jgi:hypothetical protein
MSSEIVLGNILIKSRLFPDNQITKLYLDNGAVYLNGKISYDFKAIVSVYDFIQLVVSYKYYVLYK